MSAKTIGWNILSVSLYAAAFGIMSRFDVSTLAAFSVVLLSSVAAGISAPRLPR